MFNVELWIKRIIYRKYNYYTRLGLEYDELYNVGLVAYLEIMELFGDIKIPENQLLNKISYEIRKYMTQYYNKSNITVLNLDTQMDDDLDEMGDSMVLFSADPYDDICLDDDKNAVYLAVSKLPELEQHVILSHDLTEYPKKIPELAREMKLSESRIYKIRQKALERLHEIYIEVKT